MGLNGSAGCAPAGARHAPPVSPLSAAIEASHATVRSIRQLVGACLILAALAHVGCGYSLSGRGAFLPAHIKIIGVPLFVNNTPVFEVEQKITARVRAELIGRGRYEVRPQREAVDAVLLGEIQGIAIAPAAFNEQQQATRYAVTLVAKIEFRDLKTDKVLWQNPQMVFSEQYDVTTTQTATDPNAFLGQNVNAMERLASEFARTVVSAILESF
jgi:Lipopolysaccharide-assembly